MSEDVAMTDFKVLRDGGRIDCGWREVYSGPEERARKKYTKIAEDMRQGGLILEGPEGQILAKVTAPRLRTRW